MFVNTNCPACGTEAEHLIHWDFSGLDDSVFNYRADFHACRTCGFVYISNITDAILARFYQTECSYFEKPHFDISAPENIHKYEAYRDIFIRAGLSESAVTDIGCGRGGFLTWLHRNGWPSDCTGVDIDLKSIPATDCCQKVKGSLSFHEGGVFKLPFAEDTQSLLTYFHVFEHIRNLDGMLQEACRVLQEGGHIMIEVPDAERYHEIPIGTAFWPSIREHVNHFSARAMSLLLERHGFSTVSVHRPVLPTPEFSYPSLIFLGCKGGKLEPPSIASQGDIASFVVRSRKELVAQSERLNEFCASFPHTTFWGCSAELLSLLPLVNLSSFTLCDVSVVKQKCLFLGIPLHDPAAVEKTGALVVAPYLHGEAIECAALAMGWPRKAIFRLR